MSARATNNATMVNVSILAFWVILVLGMLNATETITDKHADVHQVMRVIHSLGVRGQNVARITTVQMTGHVLNSIV